MTIVGVVKDTKHRNLRDPASPTLYTPLRQEKTVNQLYLYLRTRHSTGADLRDGSAGDEAD